MKQVKMRITKLAGFTLVETVIAMVLSIIIIGMFYTAFQIIFHEIKGQANEELDQIALSRSAISKAFFKAEVIDYSETDNKFVFTDSLSIKTILLKDQLILFYNGGEHADTLWKTNYSSTISKDSLGLVCLWKLTVPYSNDSLNLRFEKSYSISTIMNH